jgi:hypothetical protein
MNQKFGKKHRANSRKQHDYLIGMCPICFNKTFLPLVMPSTRKNADVNPRSHP